MEKTFDCEIEIKKTLLIFLKKRPTKVSFDSGTYI